MEPIEKKSKVFYYIVGFVVLLFIISWFKGCFNHGQDSVTIKTKPIVGKTAAVRPYNKPITVSKDSIIYIPFERTSSKEDLKKMKSIADSLLKANLQLEIAFAKANNKDSLYKKTIEINSFNHTWDNDTIKATVNGISRGTVEQIQLHYIIKSQKQEVKVPATVFRLLGGAEAGVTKDLSKFNTKVNLGFQNKKGNIMTISADTEERFYIGYQMSIFSIKR